MKKKFVRGVVCDMFDIPLEGIASVPSTQIIGNNIVNVDGCASVKKYDKEEIVLSAKGYLLVIRGNELSMSSFAGGRVSIRGEMISYEVKRC